MRQWLGAAAILAVSGRKFEPEVKFRLGDPSKGRYSEREGFAGSANSAAEGSARIDANQRTQGAGAELWKLAEYGQAGRPAKRPFGHRTGFERGR